MGFLKNMIDGQKKFNEEHKFDASFEGVKIFGDHFYGYALPDSEKHAIAGAKADFEHGANLGSRVTATRVILTGVLALALKKNRNKVYVLIETADGEQFLVEGPAKKEKEAREFVSKFNKASAHYASLASA